MIQISDTQLIIAGIAFLIHSVICHFIDKKKDRIIKELSKDVAKIKAKLKDNNLRIK